MDDWFALAALIAIPAVLILTVVVMSGWFGDKKPPDE
jgi:hypothetical protein